MIGSENRILLPLGVFLLALVGSMALMKSFQNPRPKKEETSSHPFPDLLAQEFQLDSLGMTRLDAVGGGYKLIGFGTVFGSDLYSQLFDTMSRIQNYKFKKPIQTIFITLDPERDTKELLMDTTKLYGPSILTMRGDEKIVKNLAEKFGVRMNRVPIPNSSLGYTTDISPWMYLTTPDYRILAAYPIQIRMERLKLEIEAHMKRDPLLK